MKNPFVTMSAVTGKPTKNDVFSYMKMLKSGGIDQVMIYPRRGCEIEYLTSEWFQTVENFLVAADKYDMYIWLNDEFHFPSGNAGGKVTEFEKYRLKMIDNNGNIEYQSYREGEFFPDLLCEDAVEYFIECTHENYYKHFKKYFGRIIKGFYTDEPAIGHCCKNGSIPYYYGMENDYKSKTNRDFFCDLKKADSFFYKNAYDLLSEKFREAFTEKISLWCQKHGVVLTGHLYEDDNPFTGTLHNGDLLKNLCSFSMPGIDDIFTDFKKDLLYAVLGVGEYARKQHDQMMSELFALGPCDMSYAKKNCAIFLAACFKVNTYFLAIAPMDFRGNMLVRGYFNTFTDDQPDFRAMNVLAKSAQKAVEYANKDYTPDVYIKYPYEICARNINKGVNVNSFYNLLNTITYHQIQWKYIGVDDVVNSNIPIIDFTEEFEYIYNGEIFNDAEKLCEVLGISLCVTDLQDKMPEGLFVRRFNDGSTVVLNLYGKAGVYKLHGKEIVLNEHGVYIDNGNGVQIGKIEKSKLSAPFNIEYYNPNMIRTMYLDDQTIATIYCEKETEAVFAVRKGAKVFLNEDILICENDASNLSSGFRKLYNTSDKIILKKGNNIVKTSNDCKFLPNVFVLGDFSVEVINSDICTVNLLPRKRSFSDGEQFSYFGKIEFFTEVCVPQGAKALEIEGTDLYTSVYVDGKCIGEKVFSPYTYNINTSQWGKSVNLKIVQFSSMGPIFGDIGYHDTNSESVKWKGNPPTGTTLFGFKEINWIF